MKYFFRLIFLLVVGSSLAQPYYIRGKAYMLYSTRSQYVIAPTPSHATYKWEYSDNTVQNLRVKTEDTMYYYAFPTSNNGFISCVLRDSTTNALIDSVVFKIRITKSFVDANSLAPLKEECEKVYSDSNDCQTNYIDYVQFKDIFFQNDSCLFGGYQDLTTSGYTTDLDMGMNYTLVLKPKNIFLTPTGDTVTLHYGVWLDYNNDGDFFDPGEFIKYGESNRLSANLINVQILNNLSFEGPRRLRIAMRSSGGFGTTEGCTVVGASGEIEDYLVTLKAPGALYGANFITPNGDGKNDFLVIKGLDPDLSKPRTLVVFDSFGHEIITKENFNNDYDGRDKNGDLPSPGIYYYLFVNGTRKLNSYYQLIY